MKRLLSITLLLSAVHLQASEPAAATTTPARQPGLQEQATSLALASAQGAADELLGAGGADQLTALMAKLEAAKNNPTSVTDLLQAAQMTAAMAAQLAPLFNAEGLEKAKAGCCKGAKKGLDAQTAGAPTRGKQKNALVKIRCTAEQAEQVQRLLGAISTHTPTTVELTPAEIALTTRALQRTRNLSSNA